MASSGVNIASQSLILLRADTIGSFSEDSPEAQICATLYDDFIYSLFSLHPWTFSLKRRLLNRDAVEPVNEYDYAHIVPAEAVMVWALYDSDKTGVKPINDYDMIGSGSSRHILSNYETLYAEYTRYVSESNWTPEFTQFAIHAFAAHIAVAVTDDVELARYYRREAYGSDQLNANRKAGLFGVAVAADSKQTRNEQITSNPFVSARFS